MSGYLVNDLAYPGIRRLANGNVGIERRLVLGSSAGGCRNGDFQVFGTFEIWRRSTAIAAPRSVVRRNEMQNSVQCDAGGCSTACRSRCRRRRFGEESPGPCLSRAPGTGHVTIGALPSSPEIPCGHRGRARPRNAGHGETTGLAMASCVDRVFSQIWLPRSLGFANQISGTIKSPDYPGRRIFEGDVRFQ
jgi:hypothetical protein